MCFAPYPEAKDIVHPPPPTTTGSTCFSDFTSPNCTVDSAAYSYVLPSNSELAKVPLSLKNYPSCWCFVRQNKEKKWSLRFQNTSSLSVAGTSVPLQSTQRHVTQKAHVHERTQVHSFYCSRVKCPYTRIHAHWSASCNTTLICPGTSLSEFT